MWNKGFSINLSGLETSLPQFGHLAKQTFPSARNCEIAIKSYVATIGSTSHQNFKWVCFVTVIRMFVLQWKSFHTFSLTAKLR
jgi:hypothetical protein